MTGDAVVLLEDLDTLALDIVHRGQMWRCGALRVDESGVENEGDTQRAEHDFSVDGGYSSPSRSLALQCTETWPE